MLYSVLHCNVVLTWPGTRPRLAGTCHAVEVAARARYRVDSLLGLGHPRIDSLPLLQVVQGDQNRIRAHQRLKTGDLRRPADLLFDPFMVAVLAYSQFPYRIKAQKTIPEEGPLPCVVGKIKNRPLRQRCWFWGPGTEGEPPRISYEKAKGVGSSWLSTFERRRQLID